MNRMKGMAAATASLMTSVEWPLRNRSDVPPSVLLTSSRSVRRVTSIATAAELSTTADSHTSPHRKNRMNWMTRAYGHEWPDYPFGLGVAPTNADTC